MVMHPALIMLPICKSKKCISTAPSVSKRIQDFTHMLSLMLIWRMDIEITPPVNHWDSPFQQSGFVLRYAFLVLFSLRLRVFPVAFQKRVQHTLRSHWTTYMSPLPSMLSRRAFDDVNNLEQTCGERCCTRKDNRPIQQYACHYANGFHFQFSLLIFGHKSTPSPIRRGGLLFAAEHQCDLTARPI